MFPLLPTPRRSATNQDQQTHVTVCCDQMEARRYWFVKPIRRFDGGVPLGEIRGMAMKHGLWLCWQPVLNR